jgi:hypothetical protein
MKRRTLLTSMVSTPLLGACTPDRNFDLSWDEGLAVISKRSCSPPDRNFDLSWDEEVQLHDGRVIVVHVKHTYERIGEGFFTTLERFFSPYAGLVLPRDTTLTFDAGGMTGVVTQLFKGFDPILLGQNEGSWYVVIDGGYYYNSQNLPGQSWGILEDHFSGQRSAKLVGTVFQPMSLRDLPKIFEKPNMLLLYGEAADHAQFDGKRITLNDKALWAKKHPPGYTHVRIRRMQDKLQSTQSTSKSVREK